jgi:hypothetical protein
VVNVRLRVHPDLAVSATRRHGWSNSSFARSCSSRSGCCRWSRRPCDGCSIGIAIFGCAIPQCGQDSSVTSDKHMLHKTPLSFSLIHLSLMSCHCLRYFQLDNLKASEV